MERGVKASTVGCGDKVGKETFASARKMDIGRWRASGGARGWPSGASRNHTAAAQAQLGDTKQTITPGNTIGEESHLNSSAMLARPTHRVCFGGPAREAAFQVGQASTLRGGQLPVQLQDGQPRIRAGNRNWHASAPVIRHG